ncbi:isocitrate dehydrogenase [NADP] cytoplasmic [Dermacentor silvarum]|uniref:isocitrate dehydrogenase [NADP] cytoplasmic n=1 Tax=Dermacentor silvarum TaxID=543639 RepID=UPI0021015B3C|nr:isocitrate dehydrogenase [NADP] cytoplasmic [Dermacentor silvarum]
METVKCGSVVAIRDDDMGRAVWDLVRKRLVQPYVDDDPRLFDLSIEHRNQTNDTIYLEAAQAYKMHNVGVKCATITAEKDVLEKYHLKRLWMSPNGAIRNAHGGDVFRKPIACRNIPPLMNQWRRSIIIARHAFGDQYNSQDFVVPGPGTLQIKYSPSIGATYNRDARCPVRNFLGGVGAQLAKRECLELQAMPRIKQASKSDLELEAAALRKERDDLAAILSSQRNTKSAAVNKVAQQQRKCIQEPEDSGNQLHKTVNPQPRMIRLKEDAERSAKKLQQEISNMKQAWV